jgi:hypothetical protein
MKIVKICFLSLVVLLSSAETFAGSDNALIRQAGHPPEGENDVTGYVGTVAATGVGIGVLAAHRIHSNAFIPKLNNSLSAEIGLMLGNNCFGHSCRDVSGHLRWDFHVHPKWTAYGAGGIDIGNSTVFSHDDDAPILAPDVKVGAFYRMDRDWILRLEFLPFLLGHRVGLTMLL